MAQLASGAHALALQVHDLLQHGQQVANGVDNKMSARCFELLRGFLAQWA